MEQKYVLHRNFAFFVALFFTAVMLGPALAHAFAFPNKIALSENAYFTVQQIYSGWSSLGVPLSIEFTGVLATCIIYYRDRRVFHWTLAALVLLVVGQVVFWSLTYPANTATSNWTIVPQNWERLRAQWEYSHLANALCQTLAMVALIVAALRRTERGAAT